MSARRVLVLVLGLALVGSACGVKTDDGPRDIPQAEQLDLDTAGDAGAGAATGTSRIYLIGPDASGQGALLQPVARAAATPTELMDALLAGANASELDQQYRSAIPVGTKLRSATVSSTTMRVDLSDDILQLSGSDLVDALAQIVFTATEYPGVAQVRVDVNGAEQQFPVGDGSLQSDPLDVYDFPGRIASAQPSYPAIPAPPQVDG
jgi:spore germination protein GerM